MQRCDKKNNSSEKSHDKLVREAFSNLDFAREFLQRHLPADILNYASLADLKLLPSSMITQALGGSEAIVDVLFEVTIAERKALLYFLIEHKSYADKFTPLQTHVYQACAWWVYHLKHKNKPLPLIFTLVFHHGRKPYTHSKDIRDLINAPSALVKKYVLTPFHLIDLNQLSDAEIIGSPQLKVFELTLKHIFDKDMMPYLQEQLPALLPDALENNEQITHSLLEYIMRNGNLADDQGLSRLVIESTATRIPHIGEVMGTIAERLEQKGWQQGMQQGMQQGVRLGKLEAAREMLLRGMTPEWVSEITKLGLKEVILEADMLKEREH